MTDISYSSPKTVDEAVAAMVAAKGAGRILAGGTDLLVQMRAGFVKPGSIIVDIKKVAEMMAIEDKGGGSFKIGAAVSGMKLHDHPTFKKAWPGVLEAINLIGSKQVQGVVQDGQVRLITRTLNHASPLTRVTLESFNNAVAPTFVALTVETAETSASAGQP